MKIKTHLGNISLNITAEAKADKQGDLIALGLQQLVFHKAPAAAFKKDSGFTRKDAYSAELEKQVAGAVRNALLPFCETLEIESGSYVKAANVVDAAVAKERKGLHDSLVGILTPELLAEKFPELYPTTEVAEEEGVE
jgi:hypothetical protein